MAKYVPPTSLLFEFSTRYEAPIGDHLGFKFRTIRYIPPAGDRLGFSFIEAYTPPASDEMRFKFGPPEYKAPQGNKVEFNLSKKAYVAPQGNHVAFNLTRDEDDITPPVGDVSFVYPEGFEAFADGELVIRLQYRQVRVASVVSTLRVSNPVAYNFTSYIHPYGLQAGTTGATSFQLKNRPLSPYSIPATGDGDSRVGNASAILKNRFVYPKPLPSTLFGSGKVMLFRRFITVASVPVSGASSKFGSPYVLAFKQYLYPATIYPGPFSGTLRIEDRAFYPKLEGINSLVFGKIDVGHEVRTVRGDGFLSQAFGASRINTRARSVYPAFIYSMIFGVPWVSRGERTVYPAGRPSEERVAGGQTFVARSIRPLILGGIAPQTVTPYHDIRDARRFVKPFSLPVTSQVIGGDVEAWVRSLRVARWNDSDTPTTRYGEAVIGLRNRTLFPSSVNQWRIGVGVTVHYFVADVDLAGLGSQLHFGATLIAYRIRTVFTVGVNPGVVGQYVHVRNAAFAVRQAGIGDTVAYSYMHNVRNLNRYMRAPSITRVDYESVFGRAFIAAGIRTVYPFDIRPAQYVPQTHWVSYLHRRVTPVAITPPSIAGKRETEVYERFNRVKVFWKEVRGSSWGDAVVANRNRAVRPHGYDYSEFGNQKIESYIRTLITVGFAPPVVPCPHIADRRQFVDIWRFSWASSVLSEEARVRNLMPDPPWTREIQLEGWYKQQAWGQVIVRLMSIQNVGALPPIGVGIPTFLRNTIIVDTGIVNYDWGGATVAGPIYVSVGSLRGGGEAGLSIVPESARFSPFNIYAPAGEETPEDYRPEKPDDPHPVDGRMYFIPDAAGFDITKDKGGWVPRPRVEHFHRIIAIRYAVANGVVSLYAQVRLAYIPKMPQYLRIEGWRQSRVGWHEFGPYTLEVKAIGFDRVMYGRPKVVELPLFNREVKVYSLGVAFEGGRHTVDFYNRYVKAKGEATALYGTPTVWFRVRGVQLQGGIAPTNKISALDWVSNYIRTVEARGWDAFNPQTAFEELETRVVNQYIGDVINAQSLVPGAVGLADVDRYTKYVSPRGLFPVPPLRPTVKGRAMLQAQGTETLVFGHVRKFEEGVVYPHEFDAGVVGIVMVNMPRQVQGFDSSMVNYPTIAAHAGATGVKSEEFGITVLKNEICCGGCG